MINQQLQIDRSLKLKPYNNTIVLVNNSNDINCEISLTQPNIEYLLHPEKANNIIKNILNEDPRYTRINERKTSTKKKG